MEQLIEIENRNGVEVVESRIISAGLGIKHKSLIQTIRKHQPVIEQQFGRVAFEKAPFETEGGEQDKRLAYLTEDQFIFIATLSRNTEQVVSFKAKLVRAFQSYRKEMQQPPAQAPTMASPAKIVLMLAQQQVEAEEKILMLENRTAELEAKLATSETDYYTVAGYGKLSGIHLTNTAAGPLGKEATKLSKQLGYNIGQVRDPRFGHVNTYHSDILKQLIRKQVA